MVRHQNHESTLIISRDIDKIGLSQFFYLVSSVSFHWLQESSFVSLITESLHRVTWNAKNVMVVKQNARMQMYHAKTSTWSRLIYSGTCSRVKNLTSVTKGEQGFMVLFTSLDVKFKIWQGPTSKKCLSEFCRRPFWNWPKPKPPKW